MNRQQAEQIPKLLKQNNLAAEHTSESVFAAKDNYIFIEEVNFIVACAEIKKVQWYQWEVSHVSVHKPRKGYCKAIVAHAERKAISGKARIMQCTIRSDNNASIGLFKWLGYSQGVTFFNASTGIDVHVFQKNLTGN